MTGGFGPSLGPTSPIDSSRWSGTARVVGPGWSHLPILTVGLLGVQILWSVEMSYASPYLLSLGLTTSHVALVFIAGPLSGLLVQPLVGAYADANTSRWGRRRPYILGGCVVSVVGMLLLGYTRAVAGWLFARDGHAHSVLTVVLAILAIFLIDFSINAVQAVDRALLVDTLPPAQQAAGNASAALMLGFGSVVGFFVGNLPLRTLLPFLNADSELQALSVLVSTLLIGCHLVTAALVRERVLLKTAGSRGPSLKHELKDIYTNARTLPRVIRQICFIQFFAWLGWFPVLFYATMYMTDVYVRERVPTASLSTSTNSTANSVLRSTISTALQITRAANSTTFESESTSVPVDADEPTRLGARAQLLSALLALAANALLPLVIPDSKNDRQRRRRGLRNSRLVGRVDLEAAGLSPIDGSGSLASGVGRSLTFADDKGKWWRRVRVPDGMRVPLPMLWAGSHLVFAGCMVGSFFTHSVGGATLLIALTGFSWGVTQWAPFSLLAEAILTSPAPSAGGSVSIRLADTRTREAQNEEEEGFLVSVPGEESDSDSDIEFIKPPTKRRGSGQENGNGFGEDGESEDDDEGRLYPPVSKPGNRSNAALLLGNPAAQVSVVDVLTPMSTWGDEGQFGSAGPTSGEGRSGGLGGGDGGGEGDGESAGLSAKAGVILGIHNIFIVIPQFLVTGLSAAIFAVFDGKAAAPGHAPASEGEGEAGRNSVVYVFRIGGIWASIAFVLAWRLARELRRR
ncbi:MFS general substrate transporter [Favolaschia claudopus]|uniref:MFS general substrate transporter n=1 Tax=Favolaschia claudopus TaxID=2862362 RepID=A0AAW0E7E2_9AGAR